jgi:hypothetical protein
MTFYGAFIGKFRAGQYGESEVAMIRKFLRAGGTGIDIDANMGDLTAPLAMSAGKLLSRGGYGSYPE